VHEGDEMIERVAMTLRRETVALSPDFDARVMQRVREEARVMGGAAVWRWMTRPRTIRVSPLAGLALAAGLAGVVAIGARGSDTETAAVPAVPTVAAPPSASPSAEQMMKFVFVNPSASSVAIVGDFNDWEEGGAPLRRMEKGVWTITIPLAPGRYHYTFVVDGTKWVADPMAPRTLEDDFGRPNSVITVGDATT
jgi:Glycogen recognition site of AMP-activated protein kinase